MATPFFFPTRHWNCIMIKMCTLFENRNCWHWWEGGSNSKFPLFLVYIILASERANLCDVIFCLERSGRWAELPGSNPRARPSACTEHSIESICEMWTSRRILFWRRILERRDCRRRYTFDFFFFCYFRYTSGPVWVLTMIWYAGWQRPPQINFLFPVSWMSQGLWRPI